MSKREKRGFEEINTEGQQRSDYEFMKETIKGRPVNRKKLMQQTFLTAGLAVIFGLVACLTFILLEPVISNNLYPEEEGGVISIPEEQEEILPENMVKTDEELESESIPLGEENAEDQNEITFPENKVNSSEEVKQPGQIGTAYAVDGDGEYEIDAKAPELEINDYQILYDKLGALATEVSKSIVTVNGIISDMDWFNTPYESENRVPGIMIADNGKDLLILSYQKSLNEADSIIVTFHNQMQKQATIKQYDSNTGLAIINVPLTLFTQEERENLKYAELGSSNVGSNIGSPVIALGNPLGTTGSMSYGMITSKGGVISVVDDSYKLMTTDIYGSQNASGFLFSMKGQLIGVINQNYNASDMRNQISAIGISELRKLIENMSNGKQSAYMGVYVADVSEEISQSLGVPKGAYVTGVEVDSPAMTNGIQKGDVIIAVDGHPVSHLSEYITIMRDYQPERSVTVTCMRLSVDGYREIRMDVTLGQLK